MNEYVTSLMAEVKAKNPAEPEFHQAVQEVAESLALVLDRHPEYRHAKILERIIEPERVIMFRVPWVGRPGRGARQPRLPHRDEQRDRPLQGRPALPPVGQPRHPEVPGLRAGLQELPDHAAHGRRQGRLRLRPEGQERQRGHALLPGLHDRALPPHRPRHRRAGRRHRRGRPRDRLPLRQVQEAPQRVHRRAHRQGPELGRLAHPARGHRLRLRLLRAGDARDPQGDRSRARPASSPAAATSRSTRSRRSSSSAARSSPCPTRTATSTTRPGSTARSWRS